MTLRQVIRTIAGSAFGLDKDGNPAWNRRDGSQVVIDADSASGVATVTVTLPDRTNVFSQGLNEVSSPDEDLLIIGSSTEARCNCMIAVDSTTIAIYRNTVTFRTDTSKGTYPVRAGHLMRLAAVNTSDIECDFVVTSAVAESGGTRFIGTIQTVTLPDKRNGTAASNGGLFLIDRQVWSSAGGYAALFQNALGNRIRCIVLGVSGANPSDWNDAYRQAQIAQFGRLGAIMISPGLVSNAINVAGLSADVAFADLVTLIQYCRRYASVVYVCQTTVASNENTSNPKVAANTTMFAAACRLNILINTLPRTYSFVRVVPVPGIEITNYGSADTTDLLNAYAAYRDKADDGIHNQWGACQNWANAMGQIAYPDFPYRVNEMPSKPFSVIQSPTADPAGKYIPNIAEGFFGTVANTGSIPNSCAASVNQQNGMSISHALVVNPDGGSDWIETITSGGAVGLANTIFTQVYTGTTTSLLTQMNLARNQGIYIDVIWQGGVYGFTELTMQYVELLLEVDTGDGAGYIVLSGMAAKGQFQAGAMTYTDATKGAMPFGWWGAIRFPRFKIPTGTVYTGARIRQSAKVLAGSDPGTFYMRMGAAPLIVPYAA